jgi:cytidylate kinase
MTWTDPNKSLNGARETASYMLAEADLDHETRDDGGLYAYVEADNSGVVIASRITRWVFYDWATMELYLEAIHGLFEVGITNAAKLNETKFEAALARMAARTGTTGSTYAKA